MHHRQCTELRGSDNGKVSTWPPGQCRGVIGPHNDAVGIRDDQVFTVPVGATKISDRPYMEKENKTWKLNIRKRTLDQATKVK